MGKQGAAGIVLENSPNCIADVATHMLPFLRLGHCDLSHENAKKVEVQQQKSVRPESHQKANRDLVAL
jgi:hypothetical protein